MRAHVAACMAVMMLILYACLAVHTSPAIRFFKLEPRGSVRALKAAHVTIWAEADDRSRALKVEMESAAFSTSSEKPTYPTQRAYEFWFITDIPCGEYRWTATTYAQSGALLARATDRSAVCPVLEP